MSPSGWTELRDPIDGTITVTVVLTEHDAVSMDRHRLAALEEAGRLVRYAFTPAESEDEHHG